MLQSMGSQTVRHDLVTEQQQSSELMNEHVTEDRVHYYQDTSKTRSEIELTHLLMYKK